MQELKETVTKLAWRVDSHEDEIKVLKDASRELTTTLNQITLTLKQIKWIAIGAGIAILGEQLGVMNVLKLLTL